MIYRVLAIAAVIGFGVLMALRSHVVGAAERSVIAGLAFVCLAVALILIGKARW